MKILTGLFTLILLAFTVCFALSNQTPATVGFWPAASTAEMPLYLVGLVPLFVGLFIGAIFVWLRSLPHRFRARRLQKEHTALNEKITELQNASIVQQAQNPPKRPFWERK